MWNDKKSIILSQVSVVIFSILLIIGIFTAPMIIRWFIETRTIDLDGMNSYFMISYYCACIPAAVLLVCLFRLLSNIRNDKVFILENTTYLRISSWCCVLVTIICLVSTIYYVPYFIIAIAAGFMALIIRIIKNVFSKAIILQEDADYTI